MRTPTKLTQRRKGAKKREQRFCSASFLPFSSSPRLCAFARAFFCLLIGTPATIVEACPFCTAVGPSFAERRAECDVVALGEAESERTFRIDQVLQGRDALGDVTQATVAADAAQSRPGDLAILLGKKSPARSWEAIPVDETSAAYYVRLPDVKRPWDERLRYAIRFLEHSDPRVADDVYRDFGRAPFDAVQAVGRDFDYPRIRAWLVDPQVPDERKGLYGLLLGLPPDELNQRLNRELLRERIAAPASEFRAGFDGILGGYLWLVGEAALDEIDDKFLRNAQAPEGDVRHAQTALRFLQQYDPQHRRGTSAQRLKKSLTLLLDRPATAPGAIQDFTRRQDWEFVERCEKLFAASPGDDPTLDRAVVGYLLVCPQPAATASLKRLRDQAPKRVAEAEHYLSLLGVRGPS